MRYTILIEEGDTSFGAYVPDLPGCVAAAATREEAVQLIHEGIDEQLQILREDGQSIPLSRSTVEYAEVA